MKGFRPGVGMSIGAALGMIFGLLTLEDWWIGPLIGVSIGLMVGAIADLLADRGSSDDA